MHYSGYDVLLFVSLTIVISFAFYAFKSHDKSLFYQALVLASIVILTVALTVAPRREHFAELLVDKPLTRKFDSIIESMKSTSPEKQQETQEKTSCPVSQLAIKDELDGIEYVNKPGIPVPVIPAKGDLVLLYDAFNPLSFNGSTTWKNIASSNNNKESCVDKKSKDLTLTLKIDPFDAFTGINLARNAISGPDSSEMGLDARSSSTHFVYMRPDAMTSVDTLAPRIDLLKLYANTTTNNGFQLFLEPQAPVLGAVTKAFSMIIGARFGSGTEFKSRRIVLDPAIHYLITLVKNGNILTIYLDGAEIAAGKYQQVSNEDVLLSNRPLQVNRLGQLKGSVHAIGFYKRALSTVEIAMLNSHFQASLEETSPEFKERKKAYEDLLNKIKKAKACPLDSKTCSLCSGVKDWSDFFGVVHGMDDACRLALSSYCQKNPGDARFCKCFDSKDVTTYNSTSCVQWRAMLGEDGTKRMRDIDALKGDEASEMCKKYCPCVCPEQEKCPEPVKCPKVPKSPPKCPSCPKHKKKNKKKSCPKKRLDDVEEDSESDEDDYEVEEDDEVEEVEDEDDDDDEEDEDDEDVGDDESDSDDDTPKKGFMMDRALKTLDSSLLRRPYAGMTSGLNGVEVPEKAHDLNGLRRMTENNFKNIMHDERHHQEERHHPDHNNTKTEQNSWSGFLKWIVG
jgi:hypothetical protein